MIGTEAVTIGGMDIIAALSAVAGSSSMLASIRGGRGHARDMSTALRRRLRRLLIVAAASRIMEGVMYSLPLFWRIAPASSTVLNGG